MAARTGGRISKSQREQAAQDLARIVGLDTFTDRDRAALRHIFLPTFDHLHSAAFDDAHASQQLLSAAECIEPADATWLTYNLASDAIGSRAKRRSKFGVTADEERCLFDAMHLCRWRVIGLRDAHTPGSSEGSVIPREVAADMLAWYWRAVTFRNCIASHHLPLVMRLTRSRSIPGFERADLVAEAAIAMLRGVELVRYHDWRFVRYAAYRIRSHMHRLKQQGKQYLHEHGTAFEPAICDDAGAASAENVQRSDHEGYLIEQLRRILIDNGAQLSVNERRVVQLHYRVGSAAHRRYRASLPEIAKRIGCAVRDVWHTLRRALWKLRQALDHSLENRPPLASDGDGEDVLREPKRARLRAESLRDILSEADHKAALAYIRAEQPSYRAVYRWVKARGYRVGMSNVINWCKRDVGYKSDPSWRPEQVRTNALSKLTATHRASLMEFINAEGPSFRAIHRWMREHGYPVSIGTVINWCKREAGYNSPALAGTA